MKTKILVAGGIVVVVLLLAAAAFVGMQLLNGQGLPGVAGGGPRMMVNNGKGAQYFQTTPAKELPQTPADVRGIFDHCQNNSFFVGTGQVQMQVKKDQSGNVTSGSSHTGPTVEAVVTAQTVVYRDVTMHKFDGNAPANGVIQQVVEPGNIDEIGENSLVTAWGKKTGDRVIADVLVYTPPPVLNK